MTVIAGTTTDQGRTLAVRRARLRRVRAISSRLAKLVVVLLLVSLVTMVFLDLLPGDPGVAIAGAGATPEQIAVVRADLGLDRSFPVRYVQWLDGIVHLDFGRSALTQQPVADVVRERMPVTLELALGALLLALAIGVPLGVVSAARAGGRFDRVVALLTSAVLSMPGFLLALLLVFFLAVAYQVFPVTGWVPLTQDVGDNLWHAALPVLALSLHPMALFTRLMRNDMFTTLQEDYILAARARGLRARRVLFRHALRPSSFSLVTVAGVSLGQLLGGTVIIESLFALPGLGGMTVEAVNSRDYLTVRAGIVILSISYVLVNALVDTSYPLLDPRVRADRTEGAR